MAKDDGNTKSKKKDASLASLSGSADGSGLRRSGRETPSKKQATGSPSNTRRSERIENQTTPSSTPIKTKPDKIEEQMGPSPLRRSDRSKKQHSPDSSGSKKLVEVSPSSNIKSEKEKSASSPKQDARDVSVDNKNERQDADVGGRKRKRMTVRGYKALFKQQRLRIEAEDGQDSNVQHTSRESGRSTESGNGEKQIGGKCSQDNIGKMSTRNMDIDACADNNNQKSPKSSSSGCKKHGDDETCHACSKEQRINNDLKNQQELNSHDKTCDKDLHGASTSKVRKTYQEAAIMENTENNNTKFVEFWVPVQLSNVQLEQYCATLLSNDTALRSCSKSDSVGALHNILISNRKCCDHPYIVDKDLQIPVIKDQPQTIHWDLGFKASGKVHFLDLILPEVKKRQLRVVILYQVQSPEVGTKSKEFAANIGDILDDFVLRRFGEDSYKRVDGVQMVSKIKQAAINNFNTNMNRFIFLLEPRACQSTIKLSSVDIVIIFNSDLIPANDIKALQKISFDSNSEQIMIFRLYSKNTLEEKVLKLVEQNVAVDSKLQNLNRLTCNALLMWGASDLFKKLEKFHGKSGKEISSEERFLKDVMEEFLFIISNKGKGKDSEKSMITKAESCGHYGNKNIPYGEIKTYLSDGEQPHVFWKNLLEEKSPRWKFVPGSTSSTLRQRKRPQYYGDTADRIAPIADVVKKRKRFPASKPVIEKETGGANEDVLSGARSESESPSGGHFWSIAVDNENHLKSTVYNLCKILKFPEEVKNTVDKFLDIVLEKFSVSTKHKSTLEALMISLCWTGALLSKHQIDRRESFSLAKKHLHFCCKEEEADQVYLKLEEAKEMFLKETENQQNKDDLEDLEDIQPPVQATCTESTEPKRSAESQHDQNVEISETRGYEEDNLKFTEEESEEIEKFMREWEEKRANLENEYKMDKAIIRTLHTNPSILRSEKLKSLDEKFANNLEEHDREKNIHLKDLKATLLAADVAANNEAQNRDKPETSISVENPNGGSDKLTEIPLELDGGRVQDQSKEGDSLGISIRNDVESTGSHTSGEQMVDVTVSDVPSVELPPHQHDTIDDDVAMEVIGEIPEKQCDGIENNVEGHVDSPELGIAEVDSIEENAKGGTSSADEAIRVDSGEMGVPGGDANKENGVDSLELGIPEVDSNEENNAKGGTSSADVAIRVESGEMGVPGGDANTENGEDSHAVEDQNDSCGSSNSNQPAAGVPQDDTPSVQLVTSQAPGRPSEIQNEPLGEQDKEVQVDPISLQDINPDNLPPVDAEINPEEPHDDPMAENQSDVNPSNELLLETTCENDANAPEHTILQTGGNSEEQQRQSVEVHNSTQQNSAPPETPNQNTALPEINMFDLQVASRIPNHGDPLQAEMERLCAVKDKFIKFHEDTKLRLKSECEKEIAEMIAQIKLKYEAKFTEEETNFQSKKKELDLTLDRVVMNKMLAAAFRAKCKDLTPSGPGMQQASQAGLMQQLHRFSGQPSMRPSVAVTSSSPGQPSGRQQTTPPPPQSPPPPPPPPLQIVHQPAALFSNTVIRPPNTNLRPPTSITPVTPTTIPPPTITPTTRPPPTITPTTRPPPTITPVTPSAGSLRALAPHLLPLVNTEIRTPAPHLRPLRNSEVRSPAPHIRAFTPAMSSSPLNSQPPVLLPLSTSSIQLPPLPPEASYVLSPPPPPSASSWQPSRSQSPQPPPPQSQPPPLRPSASSWQPSRSTSPQPPPPQSQSPPLPPSTSSSQPSRSTSPHPPPPQPPQPQHHQDLAPQIPQIPPSQPGLDSTSPDPDFVDLTDIFELDDAHPSSGHDLVYLSDDD